MTELLASIGAVLVSDVDVMHRGERGEVIGRVVTYNVHGRIYTVRHWHRQGEWTRIDGGFEP